jgi:hypothetical protein
MESTGASIMAPQKNKVVWGRECGDGRPRPSKPGRSRRVQAERTGVAQPGSSAVCDSIFIYESQDLTLRTMLSDGVAIVGQTLAGGFERY